jgi:2-polyprenyl-3-methyl-5-hydroxy-6-metoxy-1,4-benzoquinol methylase
MIKRYKEILFGLLLGLTMWIADAQMHTMMPAESAAQRPALAEELFSPDGPPLVIRLFYFGFALFAGWLLWRSNQSERSVDDLENTTAIISINWRARMINPTSNILDECNALLVSSTLTSEAVNIVKSIRRHAQQIEDFTNTSQPLSLIPGQSSNTYIGSWRQLRGLLTASAYADVAIGIVYESWGDRRRRFDRAHQRVWDYRAPIERKRYVRVLHVAQQHSAQDNWSNVLEVGCAQGLFTMELAPRCQALMACDISPRACESAAERCHPYQHVRIEQMDITQEMFSNRFDLVFALDLLEAIHGDQRVAGVADKLLDAVRPGGLLIFSGSRLPKQMRDSWWTRKLIEGADNHLAYLLGRVDVRLVHQELYPEAGGEIPGYPQHLIAIIQKTTGRPATS